MASGVDESPAVTEVDYVGVLNRNIKSKKQNLSDQFVRIRKILDEKESAITNQIDRIHKEKQEEIGNLQEMRSHSIALKKIMGKKPNAIQLGNINDSIRELDDQLSTLPAIEDKWDLDNIENMLVNINAQKLPVDTPDAVDANKITAEFEVLASIAKGSESSLGQLSKQLGGMVADEDTGRLYIADRGNDCIQVFGRDGAFLFTISHELMVSPSSISISGKHVYACNRKLGECHIKSRKNQANQCFCRTDSLQCKFYNQYLLKFSKKDGQIIGFTNINSSFGLLSANNSSLYLYSYGYQTKFESGINEITTRTDMNLLESIVRYDEIFQKEDTLSLYNQVQASRTTGCLNCAEEVTPVVAMQAFEDEVHILYRNYNVKSYNLKTRLQREINLQNLTAIPRMIPYLCWDGKANGKLILTDSKNNILIVISQLGRLCSEIEVRDSNKELVSPVAISRSAHGYNVISESGENNWILHGLKLA